MNHEILSPDTIWAVLPRTLETSLRACNGELVADMERDAEPHAVFRTEMELLEGSFQARTFGNVAVLPVLGMIRPRPMFSFFSLFSSSTNLQTLAHDLDVALNSPEIDTIVMDIDSPGGLVTGVADFAEQLYEARGKKRIVSHIGGGGDSAAYWIAAATSEIVISDTAHAGSIGTVATVIDASELRERIGIKEIEFVSSQSPLKRVDLGSDEGRSVIQRHLDDVAAVFVHDVAVGRGVDEETVITKFGQGDSLVGQRAIEAGLADRLGSFEALMSEAIHQSKMEHSMFGKGNQATASTPDAEGGAIESVEALAAAYPDLVAQITKSTEEAAGQAGYEQGLEAGRTAERERIKAIKEQDNPLVSDFIAEQMFNPEATPESVAVEAMKRIKDGDLNYAALMNEEAGGAIEGVSDGIDDEQAAKAKVQAENELIDKAAQRANGQ